MRDLCTCGKPIYWYQNEGWCHVGQKRSATWKCSACGYEGDMPDEWYNSHLGKSCPRCRSTAIGIDHYATHTVHGAMPQ